ncbi:putative AAA family ATPase [Mytilinidion resinicola]|uniref:AAA family ATPase n=1 Tax=Mytilinidion resinicola TaxID=574789 RepID=A0A6A6YAD9_9PEZI|nr:putative AAA family ATPase [Mytilinidion resinicola]KAF2804787.1 putative AAA family ATPase [Mytilinidion resinicola]
MGAAAADQTKEMESNGELVPAGMKCHLRNLYEGEPDRRGRTSWTTKYPADLDEPPENAESAQYALVARNKKCYDGRRKLRVESIVIQSPLLKKVLGVVLVGYPGITTKAKETASDPETNEHLDLLWEVLEEELRDTIREKKDLIANGVVTFDSIWTIFEPGSLVYTKEEGHDRIFKLRKGTYGSNQCGRFYALNVSYIDFDGENFGHGTQTLKIGAFAGTGPIRRLSAFPLAYHPDAGSIKKTLIARGEVFEAYKGYHFKAYQGIAMGQGAWGPIRFSVDSRIIIDTYAYNRFNPNRKISLEYLKPEGEGEDEDDDCDECDSDMSFIDGITTPSNRSTPLSEDQLMLCTPKLRGYSLKDKKWLIFFLHSVKDIVWNDQAFDSLVAPPEQKELILAFAQSQAMNKQFFDDFIQGKGRGIIMLLSGPPGVGKTLTAESVAETMKVPLYMMSAGDLGDDPSDVESSLSNILEMNTKWNAVLLLDEADVFLEARSAHDLERNKLVSIFLRLLEYYEGILFLTTNRVDNIDAAFESRIHLSLQYDDLDQASRHHVWSTFLSRSSNVGNFTSQEVDKLAAVPLNGRQIKNILKTAQLLASKQGGDLRYSHVDTVMRLRAANARKA